jgi:hypothetical protein
LRQLQHWIFCSELLWLFEAFRVCVWILSLFFSISVQNVIGILIGTVLNMYIAFDSMAICTMLILLIYKHGRFFHLLMSSSISLFRGL